VELRKVKNEFEFEYVFRSLNIRTSFNMPNCKQNSCLYHTAIYTSGIHLGVLGYIYQKILQFLILHLELTVCHHNEATGHKQAVKEFHQQRYSSCARTMNKEQKTTHHVHTLTTGSRSTEYIIHT